MKDWNKILLGLGAAAGVLVLGVAFLNPDAQRALLARVDPAVSPVDPFASGPIQKGDFDAVPETKLSSDKGAYRAGEEILLTLIFSPTQKLRLYRDLSKSITLFVERSGETIFRSESLLPTRDGRYKNEPFDEYSFQAPETVTRTIRGRVEKKDGVIEISFEGYGKFGIDKAGPLEIRCYAVPVYPHPLNALEGYTNSVTITVE